MPLWGAGGPPAFFLKTKKELYSIVTVVSKKLKERYQELKIEVPDDLLLMQVGAFMQVEDEDAKTVSDITGIKLPMVGNIDAPCVLGGFPKTGLDKYCGQLLRAGKLIVITPQDDNCGLIKKRELVCQCI